MGYLEDLRHEGRSVDFIERVEHAAEQIEITETARDYIREQQNDQAYKQLPKPMSLDRFAKLHEIDPVFAIEGLLPQGGTALLYGPEKAGKSHLTANAIRSFADDTPFLDRYAVQGRNVTLIDVELNDATLAKWLRQQNIVNTEAVDVLTLKGKASAFNILDKSVRADLADILYCGDDRVLILDCLWPILAALDLDENKDAGRFLQAFDELKFEAGFNEAIVVHHSGKEGRGPRGDSKMAGWADALWEIDVEDRNDPKSRRYFSARGRDVAETQQQLLYDHGTRQLTLAEGTRKESASSGTLAAVAAYLSSNHPESARTGRAVRDALASEHSEANVRKALKDAEERGITTTKPGPNRSIIHTITDVIPPGGFGGFRWVSESQPTGVGGGGVGTTYPPPTAPTGEPEDLNNEEPTHPETHRILPATTRRSVA